MKLFFSTLVMAVALSPLPVYAVESVTPATNPPATVYVIPIQGVIERGLVYVVRRGIHQAIDQGASRIIFDMDTPGGRVDSAEDILQATAGLDIPTCTFVNPNAISAGAIIAMGTDAIYMAPHGRIGDAMPIAISPWGAPQPMPENLEEKTVSYVASLIRSAAQRKNHDPQLAEKMVRRETEYRIGDLVIAPSNQLLTLTSEEAERLVGPKDNQRPLLSSGTVRDIPALLKHLDLQDARVVTIEITPAEKMARYIEMMSILFLAGGLLALYAEFKTPGFGVFGFTGIILLAIWFWGHHIAGLAGLGELVLFLTGAILLGIEIFAIPGFGVTGITGITLILISILSAMVPSQPSIPYLPALPSTRYWQEALNTLGIAILTSGVLMFLLSRFLPYTPGFKHLSLDKTLPPSDGFTGAYTEPSMVGQHGVADTPLQPGGFGSFGNRRLSVISQGAFIEKGTAIEVAEVQGNRIVVHSVNG
ncbi:MAG: hypothetical protein A2498_01240 [Lentisphaerae bacterium RIFOXYC12_FULL_60_16]|nr:MAG: hypothetical protein A2498_01240 [Lentisphaerae bacterium RIFOXYC12_FULL_60_16]OGV85031.1 MAG: hypothetical protein A2340_10015 [Lentisphaerae bacterium RIFOXYB12_FULL_60_10]